MSELDKRVLDYTGPKPVSGLGRVLRFRPVWPMAVAGVAVVVASGGVYYRMHRAKPMPVMGDIVTVSPQWQPVPAANPTSK